MPLQLPQLREIPAIQLRVLISFLSIPGNYTAIVGGVGGATGVSLVEVYKE